MVLLAVALVLPAASLIPLGSLWLWQHGFILYWAPSAASSCPASTICSAA